MGRLNYEHAAAVPYGEQAMRLDRVRAVLAALGDPHQSLRLVHIAGTKGKGSTGAMIAAALRSAGRSVGFTTSPHLDRLEERFAVDGAPCDAAELVALVDRVRPVAERLDREMGEGPTFFDLTTAMALRHFADRGVDAAVVEVGLGGRLDSTNVVTPAVSVVTSISLDHTRQLGPTRGLIAAEKAGILKPGVPAVSGVADADAGDVIERIAEERGCPLLRRGRDFDIQPSGDGWRFTIERTSRSRTVLDDVRPALPGAAQAANAAVALATLDALDRAEWEIPVAARVSGVARGRLPARMERFEGDPMIVIDGAHNDASAAALAEVMDALLPDTPRERRLLVAAISDDKDPAAILEPLARRFSGVVVTRYVDNPRASDPERLAIVARRSFAAEAVRTADDPAGAFAAAKRWAAEVGPNTAIGFTGSLLFAAEARRLVAEERGDSLGVPW
ncbi:MAG: folylpolyglutamate synthase/dihydrofolate synthase family protein [Planctomycetota bacterium]